MKSDASSTLLSFFAELVVYGIPGRRLLLSSFCIFSAAGWRTSISRTFRLYALVCIVLIIGQAVVLEWVTTFLFRLLRGRSE